LILFTRAFRGANGGRTLDLGSGGNKIPFTSKAMDFVNLPKIMRNDKVIEAGNGLINDDEVPMTVFQLSQPIRSTILNYSKFVSTLDLTSKQSRQYTLCLL